MTEHNTDDAEVSLIHNEKRDNLVMTDRGDNFVGLVMQTKPRRSGCVCVCVFFFSIQNLQSYFAYNERLCIITRGRNIIVPPIFFFSFSI